jgi:hypothetical protein
MSEDKPLSQNLAEHYKAIESEFTLSTPGSSSTPVEIAYTKLTSLLSEATRALESILLSAESDAVRMSGIKLVFDYTLGKPGSGAGEDELTKLVQSLTAKDPQSSTKSK